MNDKICIKAVVSGKVQGVFFRDNTQQKAYSLAITGWVKNLPDGNVEVFACGKRDAIMQLTDWLWEGPSQAEVSNVLWEEEPWETHDEFMIA